ncbi:MAG TPA: AzlC family ABC transporter permease [Gaiellaceae bacterium]|nr:AzlC family ABC transporter permease [Gaiellaceae bacterium]
MPLWLGVVPFGLAYAVIARDAGLSLIETQALSLLVFAGSAQVSAVGLFARGAGGLEVVLTTFLLNVRHVLYGMSLARRVPMTPRERVVGAYFLTDEAYGVSIARDAHTFPFVLGAELSLFITWNLATLAGALLGGVIPDPEKIGVDFVFPIAFLALLVPLLRRRADVVVAVVAGLVAWLLSKWLPGGLPVLGAGAGGALLGAVLTRKEPAE